MRLSATALDSFRLFRRANQDWMTLADLKADVYHERPATRPMLIGRAFEEILSTPEQFKVDGGFQCRGYSFDAVDVSTALDIVGLGGVHQVKAVKTYHGIDVASKADLLRGTIIQEWKTTDSTIDLARYMAAYQWRFMLDALGADACQYHVWRINDHKNTVIEIKEHVPLTVYTYPTLEKDCAQLVAEFGEFAKAVGWASHFVSEQARALQRFN